MAALKFLIILTAAYLVAEVRCCELNESIKARYDNYQLVRVSLETAEHVSVFQELESESDSFIFYGHALASPQQLTILVASHKLYELQDIAERFNVCYTVLEENLQNLIDAEALTIKPARTPASEFDWQHYFHLKTIYEWMNKMIAEHDFVTGFDLGTTYEGVVIRGLKISRRSGNTGIFIESGIHAREWIAPAVATFLIDRLVKSNDSAVVDIATNFDWYIVPVLNADGYKVTFEHDRLWRKNTKPYGKTRGVDLNRNFDINWGGIGSSHEEGTYDFCGSAPFSEPESRAVKLFLDEHSKELRIQSYFALHSFSQLYMFPYGHTTEPARNYEDLKRIGEKAVEAIKNTHGKVYRVGSAIETIYPSSGSSRGFVYDNYDIPVVFSIELRGAPDTPNMFILPADEIIPTGEEVLNSFVAALNEARRLGYYGRDEL